MTYFAVTRRVLLAAAMLTLGTLAAATTISTGSAAAVAYDCPGGMVCGWDGSDGTGEMIFGFKLRRGSAARLRGRTSPGSPSSRRSRAGCWMRSRSFEAAQMPPLSIAASSAQ